AAEPFLPELVGYRLLRQPGPSPTHDRYLDLLVPDGRRAEAVVEYALWSDWEIGHLYELEHVWSYVDAAGRLIPAEASWDRRPGPLVQAGRLSQQGARPVAYAQPGKHAMAADPGVFGRFDSLRSSFADEADRRAGSGGLITPPMMRAHLTTNPRRNALANA